jgi:hypothetical protein
MRDEYPPLDPEQGHDWWAWIVCLALVGAVVITGYLVLRAWLP